MKTAILKAKQMYINSEGLLRLVFNATETKEPLEILRLSSGERLNIPQEKAIQHVVNNGVTVVQGCPGSGKSVVLRELMVRATGKVLYVSPTHKSLSSMADKLRKVSCDFIIISDEARVSEENLSYHVNNKSDVPVSNEITENARIIITTDLHDIK